MFLLIWDRSPLDSFMHLSSAGRLVRGLVGLQWPCVHLVLCWLPAGVTGVIGPHVSYHPSSQPRLVHKVVAELQENKQKLRVLLRPRLRFGTFLLLFYFIGQNKSQGRFTFNDKRTELPLRWRGSKVTMQMVWVQVGVEHWAIFANHKAMNMWS